MPQEVHEAASMRTAEAGAIVNEFYRVHHGELSRTIVLAQLSLQQSALSRSVAGCALGRAGCNAFAQLPPETRLCVAALGDATLAAEVVAMSPSERLVWEERQGAVADWTPGAGRHSAARSRVRRRSARTARCG